MDAKLTDSLERIVSGPRLQRYRDAASSDLETVVLYCWNIRLTEALMPLLALFEVSLRNAAHSTLSSHAESEYWFEDILHKQMYENIAVLTLKLERRHGVLPTAGKIISETTFGFWARLFAKSYNKLWWSSNSPLLASVLPYHPGIARDSRSHFHQRLEYFVNLRNRVMHHEAVFQGTGAVNRPVVPIVELHGQLLETLGWISVDALQLAGMLDRFADGHREGKQQIENRIRSGFLEFR